jgi:hypothetical protein
MDTTLDGLKIGSEDFLTESEERCFKEMILRHGRAFVFEWHEIGCIDPTIVGIHGYFYNSPYAMEFSTNTSIKGSFAKINRIAQWEN